MRSAAILMIVSLLAGFVPACTNGRRSGKNEGREIGERTVARNARPLTRR